jgi:hypothetical protein
VQTATIQREGKAILLIGSIVAAHPAVLEDLKALATELKVSNVAINFDAGELKIAVQLEPCAEIEVGALVPDDAKELAAISGSGGLAAGLPSAQDLDTVAAEKAIAQTTAPPAPKKSAAKKAATKKAKAQN